MSAPLITFRIFFEDGTTIDVDASHPDDARFEANQRRGGRIVKVKRVKEPIQ